MTAASRISRKWRGAGLLATAVAAASLAIAASLEPATVAAGWLIGFVFWSQILVGSLLLIMIHRLTSGRWGEIAAPVLMPTASALQVLPLFAIPMFVAIPELYPWSHHAADIKPDVLSHYLNAPFFIVRSLIALVGWIVLSIFVVRTVGVWSVLIAALGLAFHALVISCVAIDWYLSQAAPFTSSSFGASVAVTQLIGGMAWVVAIGAEGEGEPHTADLGALLLAFVLGITYIDFMAVLVIWYGDLPREEVWFVVREPWWPLGLAAFLLISVIPIFALLLARVRASRGALRLLGVTVLIGLALYDAYLIAPPYGVATLLWTVLSALAIGLGLIGWVFRSARSFAASMRPSHVP